MIYFSFGRIPAVRKLSRAQRFRLHRRLVKELNLARAYSFWMLLAVISAISVCYYLISFWALGESTGYVFLLTSFFVWLVGYVIVLNYKIAPKALDMIDQGDV
jgi:hypothetical protein